MMNKRLMGLSKESMRAVWKNVFAQWLGLCCNMVTIYAIVQLLAMLLGGAFTTRALMTTAGLCLVCVLARSLCSLASSRYSFAASEQIKKQLREKIYQKLLLLGPSYHQEIPTSEAVQVTVEGVDQLETYFGKYLPQLFYSLLAPLTLFVMLSFVNFPSALVLLLCVPLIPVSIMAVQKFAKKLLSKYWKSYTSLGDGFLENLQGLTTLKIFGSDEAKNQEMNHRAEEFRKITMKVLIMQLNSITLMDLIAFGGAALGIIVAVLQFMKGNLDFAGTLLILLLASEFFIPLRMLGSFFHIAMNGMAASDKIFQLLDLPIPAPGAAERLEPDQGILFDRVNYSYDGRRMILEGITLQAARGITAIVGESGCGKSTIAGLLTGENKGYEGHIFLGGRELREIEGNCLSKTVTLVPHNAYLFKGSVRENLLMARRDATEEELWKALELAKLDEFVRQEKGLDMQLAENGANLSGGQKQRLALARAILHDTPVYIFDEATSNIDVESENAIVEAIQQMGKSKTVLLISHRLANVVQADCIYTLDRGQVSQSGSHQELLAQKGLYAKMYASQWELENIGREEAAYA